MVSARQSRIKKKLQTMARKDLKLHQDYIDHILEEIYPPKKAEQEKVEIKTKIVNDIKKIVGRLNRSQKQT